jgi:hypothetical protein
VRPRFDGQRWSVKIGRIIHKITVMDGESECIPEVIEIDGHEVDGEDHELPYVAAGAIYDEKIRRGLILEPGCDCRGG